MFVIYYFAGNTFFYFNVVSLLQISKTRLLGLKMFQKPVNQPFIVIIIYHELITVEHLWHIPEDIHIIASSLCQLGVYMGPQNPNECHTSYFKA